MSYELVCDHCGREILPTTRHREWHNGLCFCNEACESEFSSKVEHIVLGHDIDDIWNETDSPEGNDE